MTRAPRPESADAMQSYPDQFAGPTLAHPRALFRGDPEGTASAGCVTAPMRSPPLRADVGSAHGTGPQIASVTVHRRLDDAASAWSDLQSRAVISPYQRLDWVEAWLDTEGRRIGIAPMIVVAAAPCGKPIALLPLGVERVRGLRRAIFLGGRHTNYNMGLLDPRLTWTGADAVDLLHRAAQAMPGGVDLFSFIHQPVAWNDVANPLAALPRHQPSPSLGHRATLQADGEVFLKEHLSSAARKKLRAKATHLAALGPVQYRVARSTADIDAVLDAHIAQKAAKLTTLGIAVPDTTALRAMFRRACIGPAGGPGPLELHALHCGDQIVATFGGIAHAGRFSGLMISYALDPAFARSSPGELLLTAVIRAKCADGFAGLDLGVGEARYKDSLCPIADPLVDSFLPLTVAGHLATLADGAALRLKTAVKRSPRAWRLVRGLRKAVAGRSDG